jgi:hypothetical protein
MIKGFLMFFSIVMVTISIVTFIHFSNDHLECRNDSKTVVDQYGNTVKTEKHICKEKYNL